MMAERVLSGVIRAARERRGLSQAALGEKCGRSQPTVAHWESGAAGLQEATLELVAGAFGLSVVDLLEEGLRELRKASRPADGGAS
jgi:transcriptional regulator with XRE-family HTH domain